VINDGADLTLLVTESNTCTGTTVRMRSC